ncbi:hypothetical protein DXG03_004994 [Asterophora parasitica]|uniref:Alpha-1,3-glucosyltransferase n=1 Tax=Asterophora parasitica TaxID=117018 RepID=A0A9P7KH36_9AGAR|nr:hypothetical protein DXG03_004994 [Asterophora parasitica]
MDELSALPPDEPQPRRRTGSRLRTSSTGSGTASTSGLHTSISKPSMSSRPLPDPSDRLEIIAPTPRRHLIESSASQHWLRTPPLSPISSRGASPAGSTTAHHHHHRPRPRSFSSNTAQSGVTSFSALLQRDLLHSQAARPGSSGSTGSSVTPRLRHQSPPHSHSHSDTTEAGGTSLGRRFTRFMHKSHPSLRSYVVPSSILAALLVKATVGLGGYSGHATPPMYGDFEAQRHWMELAVHLPLGEWYSYDLGYWGLDYPPLTAYVSWVCGWIGSWIEPAWFALDTSRGIETPGSKVFMRVTVLALDLVVYIPALIMFAWTWQGSRSKRTQNIALLTLLFQPALLLIDSGHFQYNSVMLGLTLLAINFFALGHDLVGAVFFVLSLGFKQMALYYAPAIGSYLLAKCIYLGPRDGTTLFLRLALLTTLTFLLLFLSFLPPFAPFPSGILAPVSRIFPFARGLFEDKVANFWCASNVVFKWKRWADPARLVRWSAALTALGFLPGVGVLLRAGFVFKVPTQTVTAEASSSSSAHDSGKAKEERKETPFLPLLPYALLNSSMSFFLFSFQVHEKTILLPLLPITLLLSAAHVDSSVYSWGVLVNNVAVFSMWPLLKKDGLGIQYIATLLLWNRLVGHNPFRVPQQKSLIQLLSFAVYSAALLLHILELLLSPPARYPDLYPVLNVLVCTPVFVLTWLWSMKSGVEVAWALGGLGSGSALKSSQSRVVDSSEHRDFGTIPEEGQGLEGTVGSYRQLGGRAVSLGFAGSKRRTGYGYESSRTSSVAGGE